MQVKHIILYIVILFHLPLYAQSDGVKRVAVLEIIDKEQVFSRGVKTLVRSKLTYALTNISGYECYERIDVASILNELDFQKTGMVSDNQIKSIGKMNGVDFILISEIAKIDSEQIVISAKIVGVENAKLENSATIVSSVGADILEKRCRELAKTLLGITSLTEIFDDNTPLYISEIMPVFQGGGVETFQMWVMNHLEYPEVAKENGIQGRVILEFIVERNGTLTNVKILKSPDPILSNEAIRVLNSSPLWVPGKQRNRPVRVKFTLPIIFSLK